MTPAEAKALLASLAPFGMRFGLERMHVVLDALGRPERNYRVLHVAGTNGKGSTCAFAASMLKSAGRRVGLYTSPHLVRVNERIRVDGVEISDDALAACIDAVVKAFPGVKDPADPMTYFELGTAAALVHFARANVDVAVLETGLGGRLDATNAVTPEVTAITRIGLDHTAILGDTLAAIAGEKAGIFKKEARVVLSRQPEEALEVLTSRALSVGQPPLLAGRDFSLEGEGPFTFRAKGRVIEALRPGLLGPHQKENAETAIAAALALEPRLDDAAIRDGLASARWPGRLEVVSERPLTLLDGAHNPDGAATLSKAIRALYPGRPVRLVFGVLADKDVRGVASALMPLAQAVYVAPPKNERALPKGALLELAKDLGASPKAFDGIADALAAARAEAAEGDIVLIAGSLYVVGEAEAALGREGALSVI